MRCLVVGPGSVGLIIGMGLLQAGHEVAFAGRSGFETLRAGERGKEPGVWPVRVFTEASDLPEFDWIMVCTKAHQTEGAKGFLSCAPHVAVMQNGVEHVARLTPLARAGAQIVPVVVNIPATRTAPGDAFWERRTELFAGPEGQGLADLFVGSEIDIRVVHDLTTRLWKKLCWNAPTGAILALTRTRMRIFQDPEVARVGRAILEECVAVGRAEGANFPETIIEDQMAEFFNAPPEEYNSMVIDVERGFEPEWDARNRVLCRLGRKHGIATPVSDLIVPLLAALNRAG